MSNNVFSLDLKEGDRVHFVGDRDCEIRRDGAVLARYRYRYADELSKAVQRQQLGLVPGTEKAVSGPNKTSMGTPEPKAKPGEVKGKQSGSKAKSGDIPAGARWITVHPHHDDRGVPVLIMPHEDGTASVIGGAGGKLNYLKLNKLRSPEEWKAKAAERKAARAEKERKRVESQTSEEKEQEQAETQRAKEYHQTARHQNALETLNYLKESGVDHGLSDEHIEALSHPPGPDTEPDAVKEWQQKTREAVKTVKNIQRAYEHKLVTDHEARAAARLGDESLEGLGNDLIQGRDHTATNQDGQEISQMQQLPDGRWLVRTDGDEPDQVYEEWQNAAKRHASNVAVHDSTHGGQPSQSETFYDPSQWVQQAKEEQLPEGFTFKADAAAKLAELASQRKAIDKGEKNAFQEIKQGSPFKEPGYETYGVGDVDGDAIAQLEANAQTLQDAISNHDLLSLVGQVDPTGLRKHVTFGGYAKLGEIASDVLKQNTIDRPLVDALGHNEAAKLVAYQIRQTLSDREYDAVVAAQAAHHAEWSRSLTAETMEQVSPIMNKLREVHTRMMQLEKEAEGLASAEGYTPQQQIELDNLTYESQQLHAAAQKMLGSAVGQMQASAAMTAALEGRPRSLTLKTKEQLQHAGELVPTQWGDRPEDWDGRGSALDAYGLTPDDIAVDDGPDGQIATIKESGLQKIAQQSYDPEDTEAYERAIAIKRGDHDEADFTPKGFAYRPKHTFSSVTDEAQKFDTQLNAVPPRAARPELERRWMIASVKRYLGARVANGENPLNVRRDLFAPGTYAAMGLDEDASRKVRDAVDAMDQQLFSGRKVRDSDVRRAYQELGDKEAARQRRSRSTSDAEALHKQRLDKEAAVEAAHRTLAAMPMARAAMKDWHEMSSQERRYLREYAITEIMGEQLESPEPNEEDNSTAAEPAESFESGSLFGGPSLTPQQQSAIAQLQSERDQVRAQYDGYKISAEERDERLKALNGKQSKIESGELDTSDVVKSPRKTNQWQRFVKLMGSDARAYEAVRDKLKGHFLQRFASAYGSISGQPVLTQGQELQHIDRLAAAMLPEDKRVEWLDYLKSQQQSDIAKVRKRSGGKFAVETDDLMAKFQEMKGGGNQLSLLSGEQESAGMDPSEWQRTTIGQQAESDLKDALSAVMPNFEQISNAVNIIPEVQWSGNFAAHQRGLKFLQAQKKIGVHFSAGCVHGSTLLKCHRTGVEKTFAEWWMSGDRPWVKSLNEATRGTEVIEASPVFVKAYDQMYRVTLESGEVIVVTGGHRFLTSDGWKRLQYLALGSEVAIARSTGHSERVSDMDHVLLQTEISFVGTQGSMPSETRRMPISVASSHSSPAVAQEYKWSCVRSLDKSQESFAYLHQSSSGLSLSTHLSNVQRSNRKLQGCQARYSACLCLCGEQSREAQGIVQSAFPSPSDAQAQSRSLWHEDDWGNKSRHTHSCQFAAHRSRMNLDDPFALPLGESEFRNASGNSLQSRHGRYASAQSLKRTSFVPSKAHRVRQESNSACETAQDDRNRCDSSSLPCGALAACGSLRHALPSDQQSSDKTTPLSSTGLSPNPHQASWPWSKIQKIEEVGMHFVFDISVPVYHNYEAHGIFNHNSGKSAMMLGAFSHLHAEGQVKRQWVCVPSAILGQFVGEAATFLEPGKYNYNANLGMSRGERLNALRDGNNHIHVTTRESMANDLLHLVERHTGISPDDFQDTAVRTESDRRELMGRALRAEGIEPKDLLFSVDEAHDIARRKGVAASKRSLALDALTYHCGYHINASGTPLKNDISEIHDFLCKVAPEKFKAEDQSSFLKKYGQDTELSKNALQRLLAPYTYAVAVKPEAKGGGELGMTHNKPRIPLTAHQAAERSRILDDYKTVQSWYNRELKTTLEKIRSDGGDRLPSREDFAHAWNDPKVRDAVSRLASPETQANMTDEEKQAAIGGQVMAAAAMKSTAMQRLYHNTPFENNAKAQHLVEKVHQKVQAGKPSVVFSASSQAAEMLKGQMEQKGIRVGYVHGGLSAEQKSQERLKFSPAKGVEPEYDVLLCTDAAQTGLNLQRGKYLAHYDVPLTQKAWDQRSARIYRRGQTEDVEVDTLLADSPEEEIALARMERKGGASRVFQGHDAKMGHAEVLDDSGLAGAIAEMRQHLQAA